METIPPRHHRPRLASPSGGLGIGRIGKALLYSTLVTAISTSLNMQDGEGIVWGRDFRSLAAVTLGASVRVATTAILLCCLSGVVLLFQRFKRGPLQMLTAWGAGLISAAVVLVVVSIGGGFLLSLAYGGIRSVPDMAITIIGILSAWLAFLVMFAVGVMPSSQDTPPKRIESDQPERAPLERGAPPARAATLQSELTYNPTTWERRHQVALALAVAIGAAIGIVAGYMVGAVGSGADGFMGFGHWLTYVDWGWIVPYSLCWGLAGACIGAAFIYVGRLR